MEKYNEIRHGRHRVFKMHVHLVFVAKYRRKVFDGDAIDRMRQQVAAQGKAGLEKAVLEKRLVVAIVLCLFMRRCANWHHQAIC